MVQSVATPSPAAAPRPTDDKEPFRPQQASAEPAAQKAPARDWIDDPEDPDGPENIHPDGEPCASELSCGVRGVLDAASDVIRMPLTGDTHKLLPATANYLASPSPAKLHKELLTTNTDNKSRMSADGALTVVAGEIDDKTMTHGVMTLKAQNKDFRYEPQGDIVRAAALERELTGRPVRHLRVSSHGAPGAMQVMEKEIPVSDLADELKTHMQPGGTLEFDGCNIAQTREARQELQEAANRSGLRIVANGSIGLSYDSGSALRHRYVFTPVKKVGADGQ